jgi:hypothetical protein
MAIDPNFKPLTFAQIKKSPGYSSIVDNAASQGITPEEYVASRGGVNVSGYYGDSYGINSADKISLTDAEYNAARITATGGVSGASGAALNKALAEKIKAETGKYPDWWASAQANAASNNVPEYTAPAPAAATTVTATTTEPTPKVVGTFVDPKTGDV